jgi:signal peptidase I
VQGLDLTSDVAAAPAGGRPSLPLAAAGRIGRRLLRIVVATVSVAFFAACLAYGGLAFAGYKAAPVLSGSMSDIMPIGSLVIVKPESATKVKVGDVVMFSPPGYFGHYTHRVHTVSGPPQNRVFTTKGDMNKSPDPWRLRSVNGKGRVGRYVADIPAAGYVVEYAHDRRVKLFVLALFLASVAWITLRQIWRRSDAQA